MTSDNKEFNFDKSVSHAHLIANGWSLGAFNHSNPFNCHAFYIHDFRQSSLHLFAIAMPDFKKADVLLNFTSSELAGSLAALLDEIQNKKTAPESDCRFVPIILSYVKKSRTYEIWKSQTSPDTRMHMVLNIYGIGHEESIVRPFILQSNESYIHPKEIIEYSNEAKALDLRRNPDWISLFAEFELSKAEK